MLLASLLCLWCVRSFLFTGIIFLVALVGQGLVLSLVMFTGEPLNAVLIVMPGLVFVLTVSAGVHLSRYYKDAAADPAADKKTITQRAIQYGKLPCILATITTVIGLLSLSVSQMIPIRSFSLLTSTVVSLTTLLLFALLPYAMDLKNRRRERIALEAKTKAPQRLPRWLVRANQYLLGSDRGDVSRDARVACVWRGVT